MKEFFAEVRRQFGPLNQTQVDGFNLLIPAIIRLPIRHQAYILATVWHEVDKTMKPIEEYGKGKGKAYGKPTGRYRKIYYGRGLVQLTWLENYMQADKRLKELGLMDKSLDLVKMPDLALNPTLAVHICVLGMTEGWFTKKKLSDYATYKGMRYVVNGQDDADLIAGYAEKFERAVLKLSTSHDEPVVLPSKPEPIPVPVPEKKRVSTGVAAAVAAIVAAFIAIVIAMVKGGFSP